MPSPTDMVRCPLLVLPPDEVLAPQILKQVAALYPGQGLERFDTLEAAVSAGGDQAIIVAVPHPVEAIARRLAATDDVACALAKWSAEAASLLSVARRVRRRLRLVDARALALGEAQVLAQLGPAGGGVAATGALPPPPEAAVLVIAEVALLRDADALRLADEIAALRRGGEGSGLSPGGFQAALDAYRQGALAQHASGQLHVRMAGLEADAALREAELALLREAMTLQLAENQRLAEALRQAQLAQSASGTMDHIADLHRAQETMADLALQTAKVQALQRQLHRAADQAARREATLAAILLADQKNLLAMTATKARAEGLEQELHSVYASKSWRVTGPLRALRSIA